MSFTYTTDVPNPPNLPSDDVGNMQTNTNSINSILNVDHVTFLGNNDPAFSGKDGRHRQVTMFNQTAPGIAGMDGALYCNNDYPQWQNAAGSFSLVTGNPTAGTNGTTYLAGGIILQWGIITPIVGSGTPTALLFATSNINFPTNCYNISLTLISKVGGTSSANTASVVSGSVSSTGFQYNYTGTTSYTEIYWLAIGN